MALPTIDLDVTIVDDYFSHILGFTLPWVMRGWCADESIPFRPRADALQGIRTVTGSVRHIDPEARTVTLDGVGWIPVDAATMQTAHPKSSPSATRRPW